MAVTYQPCSFLEREKFQNEIPCLSRLSFRMVYYQNDTCHGANPAHARRRPIAFNALFRRQGPQPLLRGQIPEQPPALPRPGLRAEVLPIEPMLMVLSLIYPAQGSRAGPSDAKIVPRQCEQRQARRAREMSVRTNLKSAGLAKTAGQRQISAG